MKGVVVENGDVCGLPDLVFQALFKFDSEGIFVHFI